MVKVFPENCQNIWEEKLGIVTGFYMLYYFKQIELEYMGKE